MGRRREAIATKEGWLYLVALLDTCSRMIVGWSISPWHDEQLVETALSMALSRRQVTGSLLHHTDRGSPYTATDYLTLLAKHGIQASMSGKGNPYDNAMIESFFSNLRAELTDLTCFPTRQAARTVVFEYIEVFYHRQRLHSALGYRSPAAFEADILS